MLFKITFLVLGSVLVSLASSKDHSFTYNGFHPVNLTLDGIAEISSNGLLGLTNLTFQQQGHAFYPNPVTFKNSSTGSAFSFSTTFVFAILHEYPQLSGHGVAFVISPARRLPGALPSQYLGLFNESNNGNETNHVVAVELDTIQSEEFSDIDNNHVGININGLRSENATTAGYYADPGGEFRNLTLISSQRMQVWIEYDGVKKQLDVTLAPIDIPKPSTPLVSSSRDLSPYLEETMFVGFASSTGSVRTSHYVLGWSFKMNGQSQALNLSHLPRLPRIGTKERSNFLTIGVPVICATSVLTVLSVAVYVVIRNRKFSEVLEDWEIDYGPHRFKYKDLYIATKGFKDKELLGSGGFGKVYRGLLPNSNLEIAVKKMSHESSQGMREFVAEIVSLGGHRHRNLVTLLGYCRRNRELLLVYDYMPNGSLDMFLYDQPNVTLNWEQRFRVIKGVASGLFYLHEEWDKVVIHRDVKASNVLLDGEWNGRLGDFGLARLHEHGKDPTTSRVIRTFGYIAPEHARTGKATPSTDVFAFGAFMLEVACGRRPIEPYKEEVILVDWVFSLWLKDEIFEARDPNLGTECNAEEVELVLKLGLQCSHSMAQARPSMRQVLQLLEGEVPLPDFSQLNHSAPRLSFADCKPSFQEFRLPFSFATDKTLLSQSSSVAESPLLSTRFEETDSNNLSIPFTS